MSRNIDPLCAYCHFSLHVNIVCKFITKFTFGNLPIGIKVLCPNIHFNDSLIRLTDILIKQILFSDSAFYSGPLHILLLGNADFIRSKIFTRAVTGDTQLRANRSHPITVVSKVLILRIMLQFFSVHPNCQTRSLRSRYSSREFDSQETRYALCPC